MTERKYSNTIQEKTPIFFIQFVERVNLPTFFSSKNSQETKIPVELRHVFLLITRTLATQAKTTN